MKTITIVLNMALICMIVGSGFGQQKYAVLITGDNNAVNVPVADRWNQGNDIGQYGFDEFWNDTYLFWELLYIKKEYTNSNIHVLFSNGNDLTFFGQDGRYNALTTYGFNVTDQSSTKSNIQNLFTSTLASTITKNDYLFVWIMSHGGTDSQGSYFYSYDAQKVYDTQLAGWLNGINAFKKTIFLSFPSSGGFINELQGDRTIVITSSQEGGSASRADNQAPDGTFIENETLGTNVYNHGEFNYHLFSSLSGATPYGQTTYGNNNIPLSSADLNFDNFISIGESQTWMINQETTSDITQINDLSQVKNYTDLEIPTILYGTINQDMLIRGLCGITMPEAHVAANKAFTFDGIIEFYDKEEVHSSLSLDLGSFVLINDNTSISIPSDYIIINGNLNFGDYVNYKSNRCNLVLNQKNDETIYGLTFENINPNNDSIAALDIQTANFLYIRGSIFSTGTKIIGKPANVSIDSSFFIKSIISFLDPHERTNKVVIDSCIFHGIHPPFDNFSTIYLNGIEQFLISNSSVLSGGRNGITLDFCGMAISQFTPGLIINTNISENTTINGNCVGISVRSSFCEIRNNKISRNDFGINTYGNSKVLLLGNANAIYSYETQEIWGNNRMHVLSGDETSLPYIFRWNYIQVENDLEPEIYLTTPTKCKIHSIEYNYWGELFNTINLEKYFFPLKCFDWDPSWDLIPAYWEQTEDELIYEDAIIQIEQQNYVNAKEILFNLIHLFPDSEFSKTAMKDLMVIENELSPNLQNIIEYFENDSSIINNENFQKLGKSLINYCLILDGEYESALNNYFSALNDSLSYNDSIIILSNIEYVNYLIESSNGYKANQNADYYNYIAHLDCDFQKFSNNFEKLLLNPYSDKIQEQLNKLKNGKLLQNFPNPFSQISTIFFKLEESGLTCIKLCDYAGKSIMSLNLGILEKGNHKLEIDGTRLKTGIYFYSLEINGMITDTKKMTIIN